MRSVRWRRLRFFNGISFFDLFSISGFLLAVLMASLSVRRIDDHVIWMASTVFWVLMPGLARFIAFGLILAVGMDGWSLLDIVFWTSFPILAILVGLMVRLRQAHPALVLAVAGNSAALFVTPLGNSETWRAICNAIFLSG